MNYEDYIDFLDLIKTFYQGLEMDLSVRTYLFESSNSNSFQQEFQILDSINNLIYEIESLMEKIK